MSEEYLGELKKLLQTYPDEVNVCCSSFSLAREAHPTTFVVHNPETTEVEL